jgi:hypothetical protein
VGRLGRPQKNWLQLKIPQRLALPFRLRIQNFDPICRHDVDLGLALAKFDCARDADDLSLDHSKPLIGRYAGSCRNEAGELLIGVFSSEIDKCCTQGLVVTETTRPRTSTSLPTYRMASESFITFGLPAGAAVTQRSRASIGMKTRISIAESVVS